jgi:hypothetical protein
MRKEYAIHGAGFLILSFAMTLAITSSAQQNFNVTAASTDLIYQINGAPSTNAGGFFVNNCPPLTLVAGNTYTFTMQAASIHPMVVGTNFSTGSDIPVDFSYVNASPQAISSGVITLTIPATGFPSNLYYQCNLHGFYGVITVMPPGSPPPPPNQILSLSVGTNVVVISSGTTTLYTLVPQFSSNLTDGVWANVPSYTNSFNNGTNTTIFDRLEPICGDNVFLRISQQPPP